MQHSVLMSVYKNEDPYFLRTSIDSILNQTVKTDDFVIVWDGPLTLELMRVLDSYESQFIGVFRFLKLKKNVGLGNALKKGVEYCRHSLIARMDSDDIAVSKRMEWQLEEFEKNPQLALCGGQISEFIVRQDTVKSIREVPCNWNEIYVYAKKRNPMNHMTVMFRKEAVLAAGNYICMDMAEDYYLWVRMLVKGYQVENLPQVLVKARIGNGMFDRRGGLRYAKSMYRLMKAFYQSGFINRKQMMRGIVIRSLVSLAPTGVRQIVYQKGLRK